MRVAYPHPSRTESEDSLIILTGTHTSLNLPAPPAVRCDDGGCWATLRPPPVEQPDWRLLWQRGQLVNCGAGAFTLPHTPRMRPPKICLFMLFISSFVSFTCSSFISHFHFAKSAFSGRLSSRWGGLATEFPKARVELGFSDEFEHALA